MVDDLESRVLRNKKNRKYKKKRQLLIILTIFLVVLSLYQVNKSFADLIGGKETSQLVGYEKTESSIKIILFGEPIKFSKSYITKGKEIYIDIKNQIEQAVQYIIEKASDL